MVSLIQSFVLFTLSSQHALACNFHTNDQWHPRLGQRQVPVTAPEGRAVIDWDYRTSFDWHTIKPAYNVCQSGTHQSPINLLTSQGVAQTHKPDFSGYGNEEVTGNFFNWGFGPAYTLQHPDGDFTTLPALAFDDRTVYLSGWHIHFPSDHLFDGVRSRAEMHFVHVDEAGKPASVVGILIDSSDAVGISSSFFEQLPDLIGFNDTSVVQGVTLSPIKAVEEVGGVEEYWTYTGSLTTPPCTEGIRWFVSQQVLQVSREQMVALLGSGRFSNRVEQRVWEQGVNV